jgi:Right handed beta helix region
MKYLFVILLCFSLTGCNENTSSGESDAGSGDADTDADTDADSDTGADGDADSDADSDADTDADADTDSDTDTETESETGADTETEEDICTEYDCNDLCIFYTKTKGDDLADGLTWPTATSTPQRAIDNAACMATQCELTCQVWVAEGRYYIYQAGPEDTFRMKSGVEIYGGFDGQEISFDERDISLNRTILDGRQSSEVTDRVFHVVTGSNDSVLDGFTITEGNANESSAADYGGGGMYNYETSPTVSNCIFSKNSTLGYGGGVLNFKNGAIFSDCIFLDNSRGMANLNSTAVIGNCVFTQNMPSGVWNSYGNPRIQNTIFAGNQYVGIDNYGGVPEISNCVFGGHSNAIKNHSSSPHIVNSTFHGNSGFTGAGVDNLSGSSPEITNCIFWNSGDQEITASSSQKPTVTFSNIYGGYEGEGNINESPRFYSSAVWSSTRWSDIQYDAERYQTVLTDTAKQWTPDQLKNKFITNDFDWYVIAENTETSVTVWGDALVDFHVDSGYRVVDLYLLPSSPCVDTANDDMAPESDHDGNQRIDVPWVGEEGNSADMGAFEYQMI